ncbi:MAG: hypothetical protein HSCHL_0241 [Hydrogenibacillus schlegelii]|uniref:Uncharacterized protein n=1 Tax=Hydrogenibacillus schlegelii TaxID=1484 RepID=A0A2T5G886_HYDSH|nr:MAG: hypothetical protein HSCHL_0241 [Hydrogenibacillus schlegelii]
MLVRAVLGPHDRVHPQHRFARLVSEVLANFEVFFLPQP